MLVCLTIISLPVKYIIILVSCFEQGSDYTCVTSAVSTPFNLATQTKFAWKAVILNGSETSGPLTNGRAIGGV